MNYSREMTCHDEKQSGSVAEFDLILERPGKWILRSVALLPEKGLWYGRQREAMNYAAWVARTSETMLVRLHNLYQVHDEDSCRSDRSDGN